jgi:hypothetical protein
MRYVTVRLLNCVTSFELISQLLIRFGRMRNISVSNLGPSSVPPVASYFGGVMSAANFAETLLTYEKRRRPSQQREMCVYVRMLAECGCTGPGRALNLLTEQWHNSRTG